MPSLDPPPPPTHPDIPPFPSPSTFSILPDLYILLARLAPLRQSATAQSNPSDLTSLTLTLSNEPPVNIKDLPTLIYPIKQKILKGKAAVQALPDIERSVMEQEEEIRMLEGRVKGLRGRLGELGEIAGRATREGEERVMRGKREDEGEGMEGVKG